jgi:hypothetical protein
VETWSSNGLPTSRTAESVVKLLYASYREVDWYHLIEVELRRAVRRSAARFSVLAALGLLFFNALRPCFQATTTTITPLSRRLGPPPQALRKRNPPLATSAPANPRKLPAHPTTHPPTSSTPHSHHDRRRQV